MKVEKLVPRRTVPQSLKRFVGHVAVALSFGLVTQPAFALSADDITRLTGQLAGARGQLLLSVPVASLTKAQIDQALAVESAQLAQLAGAAKCDVQVDLMVYASRGPRNEPVTVSGVVLTPKRSATCQVASAAPVVSYSHGTETQRKNTLSNPQDDETRVLIAFFAAQGYAVVASDYHGYFASTLPYHPYLHAGAAADSAVDALTASQAVLKKRKLSIGKLFVTGYSQGGHAAMATHRALESEFRGKFPLVMSAPMSGAYALEETFVFGAKNPTLAGTVVGSFGVVGLNNAYRTLYKSPSEVFNAPYDKGIEQHYPGRYEPNELLAKGILPMTIPELFTPQFLASLDEPQSPIRTALRANTLTNSWTPRAPVVLCGGARDPLVPFFNTQRAAQAFASRGAAVQVIEVDQAFGLPPFQNEEQYVSYHANVLPLCFAAVRQNAFDPLK